MDILERPKSSEINNFSTKSAYLNESHITVMNIRRTQWWNSGQTDSVKRIRLDFRLRVTLSHKPAELYDPLMSDHSEDASQNNKRKNEECIFKNVWLSIYPASSSSVLTLSFLPTQGYFHTRPCGERDRRLFLPLGHCAWWGDLVNTGTEIPLKLVNPQFPLRLIFFLSKRRAGCCLKKCVCVLVLSFINLSKARRSQRNSRILSILSMFRINYWFNVCVCVKLN